MLFRAHLMRVMPLTMILSVLTMLMLTIGAGSAGAQSSQCGFITDPDRQSYCRATNGGGSSQCGFIRNPDLQARCRAETGGGSSQCGFIRDPDRQAECRASTASQSHAPQDPDT